MISLTVYLFLAANLQNKLKTGTPARIKKESIDYSSLHEQKGDAPPVPFSYLNFEINVPQISCYITHTTQKTHDLINKNLHLSAVKNGANSKGIIHFLYILPNSMAKAPLQKLHSTFRKGNQSTLIAVIINLFYSYLLINC